jgi:hypothetical protein
MQSKAKRVSIGCGRSSKNSSLDREPLLIRPLRERQWPAQTRLHAKDLGAVTLLHREDIQAETRPLAGHASEMGQIMSRMGADGVEQKK